MWAWRPHFYLLENLMDKAGLETGLSEMASAVAARHGFELVAAELAGSSRNLTVRIFIDKPGGVSIEDCAAVSRELGDMLDQKDLIPAAYTLEVSSPGIDRPLIKIGDFERFKGSLAKIRTRQPIDGQRNFIGRIVSTAGETVVFEDRTTGQVRIPHGTIAKANLEVDLEAEFRGKR